MLNFCKKRSSDVCGIDKFSAYNFYSFGQREYGGCPNPSQANLVGHWQGMQLWNIAPIIPLFFKNCHGYNAIPATSTFIKIINLVHLMTTATPNSSTITIIITGSSTNTTNTIHTSTMIATASATIKDILFCFTAILSIQIVTLEQNP